MPGKRNSELGTERRLARSKFLDRMSAIEIVQLMNLEDRRVAGAVGRQLNEIAEAVEVIVAGLKNGGRLIYVGAGSSGRVATMDAAECRPTFGVAQDLVQVVMAGSEKALHTSIEGAEDAAKDGERAIRGLKLKPADVVVGIAASGTTPFVIGALQFAQGKGSAIVAVTANAGAPLNRLAEYSICCDVGPEVLTGSTRLKAGTAQKMVLNMLSTAAMVRLGHAYENLMVDMRVTNQKLSERAKEILVEVSGADALAAEHALRKSGHNVRMALVMLEHGTDKAGADKLLRANKGDLRATLKHFKSGKRETKGKA